MKILIVDDDCVLLEQLEDVLKGEHYVIETACNGENALKKLSEGSFDLVILDIMIPGIDGLSVLRETRNMGVDMPILMLSAKGDTEDRVHGLDLGADDYLGKPFSLNELLARVRALLRRREGKPAPVLRVGNIALDTITRIATMEGVPLDLTSKEFGILEFLMYNKNRAVSRLNLAEHVWHDDFDLFSMSNFIDVHIKNLRRKIGNDHLRTIRGIGYVLKDSQP
jgi:DNA-binding response OmpR family regulator